MTGPCIDVAACHVAVTVVPTPIATRLLGAVGRLGRVAETLLDSGLEPAAFTASTVKPRVAPLGSWVAVKTVLEDVPISTRLEFKV